jgi:hypothetical protein
MIGFASGRSFMIEISGSLAGRVAVVAILLSAAGALRAADTTATTPPPKTPILTPAQLRECLGQKDKLHAQKDDVIKYKAALDADKAEIDASEAALGQDVLTLDKTNGEAVDAYNARVRAREQMFESYKSKVVVYNGKVDAVTSSQSSYSKACENRRYDERDLSDPKAKK